MEKLDLEPLELEPVQEDTSLALEPVLDLEPVEAPDESYKSPRLSAIKSMARDVAAQSIEALGFNTKPAMRVGEAILPYEKRVGAGALERETGRTGVLPEGESAAGRVLSEIPAAGWNFAASLPGQLIQFAILKKVSPATGVPRLARAGIRAVPTGTKVTAKVAQQALLRSGPEVATATGLQMGGQKFAEEMQSPDVSVGEALLKATPWAAGGFVGGLAMEGLGAAGQGRAASRAVRAAEAAQRPITETTEQFFDRLVKQGVPASEAARIAESKAPQAVSSPEVLKSIQSAERFLPGGEGQTNLDLVPEGGLSRPKSLSEAYDDLVSRSRGTVDEKAVFEELGDQGYAVGAKRSDFLHKVAQDRAAIRAGSEEGRVFREIDATRLMDPAELKAAYEQYGISPEISERLTTQTMRQMPEGPKSPSGAARLQESVERGIAETDAIRPRPEEMLITTANGKVQIERGTPDINLARQVLNSPSRIAATHRKEFYPVWEKGVETIGRIQDDAIRISDFKKRWNKVLDPSAKERIFRVAMEQEKRGVPLTAMEMAKGGVGPAERDFLLEARGIIRNAAQTLKASGHEILDPEVYWPHMFKGSHFVFDKASGTAIGRASSEKEIMALVEPYLAQNPNAKIIVTNPVNIPQEVAALAPRAMRKKFAAYVRDSVGPEQREVDRNVLVALKAKGERFFGPAKHRGANLASFIKDPVEALSLYAYQLSRKVPLDEFNQFFNKHINSGVVDPAARRLLWRLNDYAEWINNPTGWSDQALRQVEQWTKIPFHKLLGATTQYEAVAKLGFSPSSAIVNMAQTFFNTDTVLGPRWTTRGMWEYLRTTAEKGKNFATNAKILQDLRAGDALNSIDTINQYSTLSKKGMIDPLWAFKKVESANKGIAALGEYWRSREALGLSHAEALQNARLTMTRTQFNLTPADMPPALRGRAAKSLVQFKTYGLKEIEFFEGLSAKEKAYFIAKILAVTGPAGAAATIPFAKDNDTLNRWIAENPKVSRGLLGAMGVDMSETWNPFNPSSWPTAPWTEEIVKGAQAFASGDPAKKRMFYRSVVPRQAMRSADALQQSQDRMYRRPSTGEAVIPVTPREIGMQLMGIRPLKLGEVSAVKKSMTEEKASDQIARRRAVDALQRGEEPAPQDMEAFSSPGAVAAAIREKQRRMTIPEVDRLQKKAPKREREAYQKMLEKAKE